MSGALVVEAGQELPARVVGPLTQADVLRFAGACGDFNPLHYDTELARRAGFDAPIAMGQMTAGIVAAWIADWCGVERLAEFEVRFVAPVLVGDTITLTGEVADVVSGDDGREIARLAVVAAKGETVVVKGRASAVLAPAMPG
ncbi:MaoC family dehydratase [Saccharopolyspora pogona]|uniref:MaoC family dehydratase n=1 Tax=Saccharopolyspora pogona TaxID=333966 RepID=UPI001CC23610|nr:MaoC/PaaZ C-terminal domain-containing protein [Saccharopolyspora pogona]